MEVFPPHFFVDAGKGAADITVQQQAAGIDLVNLLLNYIAGVNACPGTLIVIDITHQGFQRRHILPVIPERNAPEAQDRAAGLVNGLKNAEFLTGAIAPDQGNYPFLVGGVHRRGL